MCPHSFYIIYMWYYHVFLKEVNYFSDPKLWCFPVFQDGAKLVSKNCFSRGEIRLRNFCYCLVSSRLSLVRIQNNGWHGNVGQLLVPVTESIYFVEWNGNGFLNKRHPLENPLWKKILAPSYLAYCTFQCSTLNVWKVLCTKQQVYIMILKLFWSI